VDCLITIHNTTKFELKLIEGKSERGNFKDNPPKSVPPGPPITFVQEQTPQAKDPKQLGCQGFLKYKIGSPGGEIWHCKWENLVGETNKVDSEINPKVPGLGTLHLIGQGDENVAVDFTLSSNDTEGGGSKAEYPIGPFKWGEAELESGDLTGILHDILHKKLPAKTKEAILQGERPGGKLIEVHGYTDNTGKSKGNMKLSEKRANAVISEFGTLKVSASLFKVIPHGEYGGANPTDDKTQEKKDPNERKVILIFPGG